MTRANAHSFVYRILTSSLLLTGMACQVPPEPHDMNQEWNLTLLSMGIHPVHPPREDVQVGDVYLHQKGVRATPSDEGQVFPLELWVANIDVGKDVSEFYAARAHFPDSTTGMETTSTVSAAARAEGDTFLSGDNRRLRQVVFPEFSGMTIKGDELQWLVPVEVLSIAAGSSSHYDYGVTLKIPAVESYGLPMSRLLDHIVETEDASGGSLRLKSGIGLSLPRLRAFYMEQSAWDRRVLSSARDDNPTIGFEVLTEVYYARAIDISVSHNWDFGPRTGSELDLVEELNKRLDAVLRQTTPGTSVRVLGANDSTVVLRRSFQRPIAIGFRSFVLSVNPNTGQVAGIGPGYFENAEAAGTSVEEALSLELSERFQVEARAIQARYHDGRWVFTVMAQEGGAPTARYLFVGRSERAEIADRIRDTAGSELSAESERQLSDFVEGLLRFQEENRSEANQDE